MKQKFLIIIFLNLLFYNYGQANDYVVEFLEENYKEQQIEQEKDNVEDKTTPIVYHSIQVETFSGHKVIVLQGQNYQYRQWLRQYMATHKKFVIKVPEERNDEFISSKAFEIDVINVHPIYKNKSEEGVLDKVNNLDLGNFYLSDDNYIFVIDSDYKRTNLLKTIINDMGYKTIIFSNGKEALNLFKIQPDKIKMVVIDYNISGISAENFIKDIIKINNKTPIILGTGFKNTEKHKKLYSMFGKNDNIIIKAMVLTNLKQTINNMLGERI